MTIGIVTAWFERGAAYVSRQFKEILEKEHDVYIYARGGEMYATGNPLWDTKEVWWGKRRESIFHNTNIDKKDFLHWIEKRGIELIIFNEQKWFVPLLWCKEMGVKTIAYIDYYTKATIPLFGIYDALICNTRRHYSAFNWHKGAYYIPWGTNIQLYTPTNENLVCSDTVTFFHSAGMNGYRKGTDILLKAYLNSRQRGRLVIHTQIDLKKQFPDFAKDMEYLVKMGKLDLIDTTVTAPGLYYKGDVYVYPSRLDGIGLTIAEALSSGLACIVTDNAPMNEFVDSGCGITIPVAKYFCREDGYYWPMCEVNIDKLTDILNDCSENPEKIRSMKKNARAYAEQHLSQDVNFEALLNIVKETTFTVKERDMEEKILQHSQEYGIYGKLMDGCKMFYQSLRDLI